MVSTAMGIKNVGGSNGGVFGRFSGDCSLAGAASDGSVGGKVGGGEGVDNRGGGVPGQAVAALPWHHGETIRSLVVGMDEPGRSLAAGTSGRLRAW
jgi:hypothetical protein